MVTRCVGVINQRAHLRAGERDVPGDDRGQRALRPWLSADRVDEDPLRRVREGGWAAGSEHTARAGLCEGDHGRE